jgi:hypothetical protein
VAAPGRLRAAGVGRRCRCCCRREAGPLRPAPGAPRRRRLPSPAADATPPAAAHLTPRPPPHAPAPPARPQVAKTDTLVGLAVRYNISVADIKRANGLLTDASLFARDYVSIPTKQMAVG